MFRELVKFAGNRFRLRHALKQFIGERFLHREGSPRFGAGSKMDRQFVIVTGVPTETDLKNASAMNSGIRMQP